ncbi:MAG: GDSL-type esterase/lipase family protein [Thalassobaculales bacterium]
MTASLPPLPARKSLKRIAFFGDAFTAGAGDESGLGWVGRLVQDAFARNHDLTAYNLGIRGAPTRLIMKRWREEAEARLPPAADARLVFMFGGNDAKQLVGGGVEVPIEESVANARAILSAARDWLPTLWIGLIPMNEARPYPRLMAGPQYTFSNARQAEYNARYQQVAAEIGVPFLDLHTPLLADPDWPRLTQAGDGSNPAAEGYARIAAMIAAWPAWRSWFE